MTLPEENDAPQKSFNESLAFLKENAQKGVIINRLHLWIDIQRKTTAENVWKLGTFTL